MASLVCDFLLILADLASRFQVELNVSSLVLQSGEYGGRYSTRMP